MTKKFDANFNLIPSENEPKEKDPLGLEKVLREERHRKEHEKRPLPAIEGLEEKPKEELKE